MERSEATSIARALVLSSASLAGLEVAAQAPERFAVAVRKAFDISGVTGKRRPEAVGNLLRWIAATLEVAQEQGESVVSESTVDKGHERICPVWPFD